MFEETKILNLLDRVLGGKHRRHKKQGQFDVCPFCNHYKPKLEVNILNHCRIVGFVTKKVVVYLHY